MYDGSAIPSFIVFNSGTGTISVTPSISDYSSSAYVLDVTWTPTIGREDVTITQAVSITVTCTVTTFTFTGGSTVLST